MTPPAARSKADAAHGSIRAGILDGTYPPGGRLVVDRLARELEVSAVPVREAMRRLEAEGYVRIERNLGATVAELDSVAFAATVVTLAVLEGAAVALSSPHLTADDLAAARHANAEVALAVERLDEPGYTDSNLEFHRILYSRCPIRHLVALIEREWTLLRGLRQNAFVFEPVRGRAAVHEHDALLACLLLEGETRVVEDLARAHRMRTAAAVPTTPRSRQRAADDPESAAADGREQHP